MKKEKRIMAAVAAVLLFVICAGLWNNADAAKAESMHDDVTGLTWKWTEVVEDGVRYAENVYVTGSDFTGAVLSDNFLKDKDGNAYRIRSIGGDGALNKDSFIQTDDFQPNITIDASACGYLEMINPFSFCDAIGETLILPNTVRKVSDNAFYGTKKMTVACDNPNIIFGDTSGIKQASFQWKGPISSTAYEMFAQNGQFTSNGQTAYKCILDGNGDATDSVSIKSGLFGSFIYVFADGSAGDICKVAVPAREHYEFNGYYTAREGGVQIYDEGGELVPENVPGNVTKDTILYARWSPIKYRISFHLGDGVTGTLADQEIIYGAKYSVKDNYTGDFTKAGYSFKGWSRTDGSSNIQYPCGSNFSVTGDMDLYAVWVANRYSIEYYDSGVLCGSDDAVYDATMNLTSVEDLGIRKTGHAFTGWSLEDGGKPAYIDGGEAKNLTTEADGTVKLHAVWNPNSYDIIFDANKGDGLMDRQKMTYGISASLPSCTFARKGYTFLGWALEDDSAEAGYADMEEVENLSADADSEVTLYAVWQANRYYIAYHGNGGSGIMQNTVARYDSDVPLTRNAFGRTGYSFMGWTTDKAVKDISCDADSEEAERIVDYRNVEIVKGLTAKAEGMVHLYAVWQEIRYSISYNKGTGDAVKWSTAAIPARYVYGESVALPTLIRDGYDFLGWHDGSKTISIIDKEDFGNKSLTAMWKIKTYSISYDDNAGTDEVICNGIKALTYQYGQTVTLPPLSRRGYEFKGWMVDGKLTASTGGSGDKNCTAVWEVHTYSITYRLNGGTITEKNYAKNYTYGTGAALPVMLEKEGCTFGGWQDLSGKFVSAIGDDETGDRTYIAAWSRGTYSVSIETNGGIINDAGYEKITSYKYDSEKINLPTDVTKAGYAFMGWFDMGLGQFITEIDTTICSNRNIFAKWKNNASTSVEDIEISNTGEGKAVEIPSTPMNDGNYYFSLLSGMEKCIYTALFDEYRFDSSTGKCNNAIIQLRSDKEYTYANVRNAGVALCWDHPEIFWIREYRNSSVEKVDGYHVSMVELEEAYSRSNYLSDATKYKGFFEEILQNLKDEKITKKSGVEKIRAINAYVVDNYKYDVDTKILNAKTTDETRAVGYVLSSGRGCCEGYAKLTKVLCDYYGIPCIVVTSNDHMWNQVKVDNTWYILDVTWNDNGYNKGEYFLKGSKSVKDKHHVVNNAFYFVYGKNGEEVPFKEYGCFAAPKVSKADYGFSSSKAKTATSGKVVYRISGKKAAVQKASSKKVTKITVKDSVKIGGKTYKVTSINKNAFKNCKKLRAVTVNARSIAVIGTDAFRGCGKLRSVQIKSAKLTKVGKGAFKGISKKAAIKVPGSRSKKYKKMLKKAGLPRAARFRNLKKPK